MQHSTFEQPLPEGFESRMSEGYGVDSGAPLPFEYVTPAPAGALSATPADVARFMLAQLGDVTDDRRILQPQTATLMHAPALDDKALGAFASGPRMTLGFFDENRNGHRIIGHGGDTTVFHSHLQLYPDDATGIFVTFNSSGTNGIETLDLRDAVMHGFSDRYFPGTKTAAAVEKTASAHAALAQGTYQSTRLPFSTFAIAIGLSGQTHVTAQADGTLLLEPGPSSVHPMVFEETAPWVWSQIDGDEVITMKADGDGVAAIGFSSAFTMTRVTAAQDGAVVLPLLGLAAGILLLGLLAAPAGAITRRFLRAPRRTEQGGRLWRVLTRIGVSAALLGLVGWIVTISIAANLQDVPDATLRVLQVVQLLGVLGLVPAAVWVVKSIASHQSRWRVVARVLVVLSLSGVTWFAFSFNLIAPSVSY
jgi:Beta-lactamase